MRRTNFISAEQIREVLDYDPLTGVFKWRINKAIRSRAGNIAGTVRKDGRRQICIDGTIYPSASLAWCYMTGNYPTNLIDHKDHNPSNDAFDNLREATYQQNNFNKSYVKNKTGFRGVHWNPQLSKWGAVIHVDGKSYHLGTFTCPEDASLAYEKAAKEIQGEYYCPPQESTKI